MYKRSGFRKTAIYSCLILFLAFTSYHCSRREGPAKRVILIGIDGLGVSGFQQARTPNLDELVQSGAISLGTRSVMPTVSAPNWGSHLLGAGPEQHGITYNGWTKDNHSVEPVIKDDNGYFPSVFNLIREQMPEAKMGFFYDWDALSDLFNVSLIDKVEFSRDYINTLEKATPWIIQNKPEFTFLYFGHPDEEGHAHQWGSGEYIKAVEDVDAALGEFFAALREAGLFDDTHILVVSDHGGVNYGHGGLSMEEIQTPWIISGPGIISDLMIDQPNDVFNTAATIAFLFDLDVPYAWIGRPVLGAFAGQPESVSNTRSYVPMPMPSLQSGLYLESEAVAFSMSDPKVKIRFSLDGTDPDTGSPIYKSPVLLQKSGVLKAAGFRGEHRSQVAEVDFVKVLKVKEISLKNSPDEKYAASGARSLVDLEKGSNQFNDGKWLGFRGDDLEALLTFDGSLDVSRFSVGIINNPGSWIFPPPAVVVMASVDGTYYSEIGRLDLAGRASQLRSGRNELNVKITPAITRYLKVVLTNTGLCPEGHPGAGEPAWLFVDELIIE